MSRIVRVVKVGGSLLDWTLLPRAFEQWLERQPPALNVLLCGGGRLADCVREADRSFFLGNEQSHWLAVDCLSITARLLAAILHLQPPIERFAELLEKAQSAAAETLVFDCQEYLRAYEPTAPGVRLPYDWSATSDSIAARLAATLSAEELVLLKSNSACSTSLAELAGSGFVDAHFPVACRGLTQPRIVNLREFGDFT